MSEKKRFVQSKYANHLQDIKTDTHYYLTSEKIGCKDLFDEIERLTEENEQLKQQLLYDGDDICSICKHEYLTPSGDYFIGKCEKGHEECSKEDKKYCEDFKLKEAE